MMRPKPAACIAGSAAWVQAKAETRLTASSRAQSSGVVSVKNACWSTPALLTTISNGPCCDIDRLHHAGVADIEADGGRPICAGKIGRGFDIEIGDHDMGAGFGKAAHDRRADALRAAGDEGAAAIEPSERPGAGAGTVSVP